MKTNVQNYSDKELSLLFLNDESLYYDFMTCVKREKFDYLEEIVKDNFIFNPEQLKDLEETFNNEVKEYFNY